MVGCWCSLGDAELTAWIPPSQTLNTKIECKLDKIRENSEIRSTRWLLFFLRVKNVEPRNSELTRLFELLISLLGINGVPRVVNDEQEVGHAPAIHPAGSDVRKKYEHSLQSHNAEFFIISSGFSSSSFVL